MLFEQVLDDAHVRIVDISDAEPSVYTCMVRLEKGESWRLIHVNEPAYRTLAVDDPEAMLGAAQAAVSFARDRQERLDRWGQGLSGIMAELRGSPPLSMYQVRCGVVVVAFGMSGSNAVIVHTDLLSLAEYCSEAGGSAPDDVGLDLGPDAPDHGIWAGVVRESITPERNTPDGYEPQELEFDMVKWGDALWHYADTGDGELVRIDGQEDEDDDD